MKLSVPRDRATHSTTSDMCMGPTGSRATSSDFAPSLLDATNVVADDSALSEDWLQYGRDYELTQADLHLLRKHEPCNLSARTLSVLARRLYDGLVKADDWECCEIVLTMLVRSDLLPWLETAADLGLGHIARCAMESNNLDAPGSAGTTARLGRVLVVKLYGLNELLKSMEESRWRDQPPVEPPVACLSCKSC